VRKWKEEEAKLEAKESKKPKRPPKPGKKKRGGVDDFSF
jgi:hypothetical protein